MATTNVPLALPRLPSSVNRTVANNPLVSPVDLYRSQIEARQLGPISDPYNVGRALGTFGANYGRLADQVRAASVAQAASNAETAAQDAGYYPAIAGARTTAANLGNQINQDRLNSIRDVEAAFQAALQALGPDKVGTDEFNQYMQSHVNTSQGAAAVTPEVNAGYQREQVRNLQKGFAKQYMDNHIYKMALQQYLEEHKGDIKQLSEEANISLEQAQDMLIGQAKQFAMDKVKNIDVQPDVDPRTGEVTVYGPDGKIYPLDSQVQAAIQAMAQQGKGKTPFDVGRLMLTDQEKVLVDQWKMKNPMKGGTTAAAKAGPLPKLADNAQYTIAKHLADNAGKAWLKAADAVSAGTGDPKREAELKKEYMDALAELRAVSQPKVPAPTDQTQQQGVAGKTAALPLPASYGTAPSNAADVQFPGIGATVPTMADTQMPDMGTAGYGAPTYGPGSLPIFGIGNPLWARNSQNVIPSLTPEQQQMLNSLTQQQ